MLANAVKCYEHLCSQGMGEERALDHAVQRFGVERDVLRRRVQGFVAEHDATMSALAAARSVLETALDERPGEFTDADTALFDLYVAITGEDLG